MTSSTADRTGWPGAKCAFHEPKRSARTQLIEGKANLLRLRQEMPLLDHERAAVDDGVEAMDALLARLAGEPTPDGGPLPRRRAGSEVPVRSPETTRAAAE